MTLTPEQADAYAAALYNARKTRIPIAPLTQDDPSLTMADGYAVQQGIVRRYLDDGDHIIGYKLGLTSKPMQEMLKVDSPDFAPVMASHVNRDGTTINTADYIAPRLEAEIALTLGADLEGADLTGATLTDADLSFADLKGKSVGVLSLAAGTVPNLTVVPVTKPVPAMTTVSPPTEVPVAGVSEVTTGVTAA